MMASAFHTVEKLLAVHSFAELPTAPCQEDVQLLSFLKSTKLTLRACLVLILSLSQAVDGMDNAIGRQTGICGCAYVPEVGPSFPQEPASQPHAVDSMSP